MQFFLNNNMLKAAEAFKNYYFRSKGTWVRKGTSMACAKNEN